MKPQYKIENWYVHKDRLVGICPEHKFKEAYKDKDPERLQSPIITTTMLQLFFSSRNNIVETRNSTYILGTPRDTKAIDDIMNYFSDKREPWNEQAAEESRTVATNQETAKVD